MLISEFPVVSVHIPPVLRMLAGGRDEIMASGETIGDVLKAVGHGHPDLGASLLCADGSLANGLAVYCGSALLQGRNSLATPVDREEVVSIVVVGKPACPTGLDRKEDGRHPAAGERRETVISVGG